MQPELAIILLGLLQAFHDGLVVKTERGNVTLHRYHVGDLVVTSGHIVACDPQWVDADMADAIPVFSISIRSGQYPVILTIQHATKRYRTDYKNYQSVAFATLRIREQMPVRWDIATVLNEDPMLRVDGEIPGYGVDSGTGCFMDKDAAQAWARRLSTNPTSVSVLDAEIEKTYVDTWGWANVSLKPETSANLIAFTAGAGDGAYSTYVGYDADDAVVCLVTDFALLWPDS